MKRHEHRIGLIFFLTINLFIMFGCSSVGPSKPNDPFAGPYPAVFIELTNKNPLLAEELSKLPEFQDGISEEEAAALGKIVALYNDDPVAFDATFNEMYKIGLPGIRKYCSPLQALFWLAEDNNLSHKYLVEYSLPKLLSTAWKEKDIVFKDDQILQIIEVTKNKRIKNEILQYTQKGVVEDTSRYILRKYKNRPDSFPSSAQKIIRTALLSDPRWNDTDAIIDRLNAPELLDFYINKNISYAHYIPSYHRPPRSVIEEKYGDCDDLAYFGKTVLKKTGYDVFGRIVGDEMIYCHIGLGIRLEDGSYILAVNFTPFGNDMSGPYKTVLQIDRALGYEWKFKQRGSFHFDWNRRF